MTKAENGRYADRPGQIPWPGWKAILMRAFGTVSGTDLSQRCAGVAFFSFLSIFPFIASFVLIYGLVSTPSSLQEQLAVMEGFVPASVYQIVQERLESLLSQPQVGLGIGLLVSLAFALWSGSRGVNSMIATLSSVYHEKDTRSFVVSAALSIGLTIGGMAFALIVAVAIAAVPIAVGILPVSSWVETLASLARWPILAVLVSLGLSILYRLAPPRSDAKWKWITPGAVLATVLWLVLTVAFSFYVENFGNYGATFGSLSVAVVMMLWIYYSALVVATGAALNAELELQTKVDTTTGPNAPMGQRGAYVADNLPEQSD